MEYKIFVLALTLVCVPESAPITTTGASETPVPTTQPQLPPTGSQTCPSEVWQKYGDDCFLFQTSSDASLNWEDAVHQCVHVSGGEAILASIHDEMENWFIRDHMASTGAAYWIGLFDNDAEGSEDCFTRMDGKNTLEGVLDRPEQADGENTFHFGKYPESDDNANEDAGVTWCQTECGKHEACASYSYGSMYHSDEAWKSQCVGRVLMEVEENNIYFYSGYRQPCPEAAQKAGYKWIDGSDVDFTNWSPDASQTSSCVQMLQNGEWIDTDCHATKTYVCRWKQGTSYTTAVIAHPSEGSTEDPSTGEGNAGKTIGIVILVGVGFGIVGAGGFMLGSKKSSKRSKVMPQTIA